jgi:hypothetical protein
VVAFVVSGGRLAVHEDVDAAAPPLPRAAPAPAALDADQLDELLVVASFAERAPAELTLVRPAGARS